jgi:hypothetical protein
MIVALRTPASLCFISKFARVVSSGATHAIRTPFVAFNAHSGGRRASSLSQNLGSKTPVHGGGALVDRMVSCEKERAAQVQSCRGLSLELSERQACDVELITTGAFSPIQGFMSQQEWCVPHPDINHRAHLTPHDVLPTSAGCRSLRICASRAPTCCSACP